MKVTQNIAGRELRTRYVVVAGAFLFGLALLGVNLFRLQVHNWEKYTRLSEANYIKITRKPADRGMILDRRGEILVDNRPSYNLSIRPAFCQPGSVLDSK